MLAGREFGVFNIAAKPYAYAINYVMEMLMVILNEKQEHQREPDRWAMHLRVCFGHADAKDYDRSAEYAAFVKKLAEYDYTAIEQGMLDAYHRLGTRAVLDRLASQGLVAAASHMPGEGGHWVLTSAGHDLLKNFLDRCGDRAAA